MLHEILLGLSGYPSPLFEQTRYSSHDSFPGLTNVEKTLLKTLSPLALAHRFLRHHTSLIARTHVSVVCRAVAASIQSTHLGRFQRFILDVESKILKRDAALVGAYNAVPLASIVAEFEGWQHPMEWYCKVAVFMQAPENAEALGSSKIVPNTHCSAAQLLDRLREESRTGFETIESIAKELGAVAEATWLRQISSWILYGKLPSLGGSDVFVGYSGNSGDGSRPSSAASAGHGSEMVSNYSLLPKFVSEETASMIFAVGRLVNSTKTAMGGPVSSHMKILPDHARRLSELPFPLTDSSLRTAIQSIRHSFSQKVLRHILPLPRIQQLLDVFNDFFLLSRGEFPICLVAEADKTLHERRPQSTVNLSLGPDIVLREAEISHVLSKTWNTMLTFIDNDGIGDSQIDFARDILSLQPEKGAFSSRSGHRTTSGTFITVGQQSKHSHVPPSFHDLLLSPTPVSLSLRVPAPLDLFVGVEDVELYSYIHAYLLSIRRAQIKLSDLWRQSTLRRDLPAGRSGFSKRLSRQLRPVWAVCSTSLFILSGMTDYFIESVVRSGWKGLMEKIGLGDALLTDSEHDPEAMADVHREFLQSLYEALLLDDQQFTVCLHSLLADIDSLVSAIVQLERVVSQVQTTDDSADEVDYLYTNDLLVVQTQLGRDRKRVEGGAGRVVVRLGQLSQEGRENAGWKMGGLEQLLLRLHFAGSVFQDGAPDHDGDSEDEDEEMAYGMGAGGAQFRPLVPDEIEDMDELGPDYGHYREADSVDRELDFDEEETY